jgi:Holliday junction DNA helicase RuvB
MRSRFGIPNRLDYYTVEEIQHILMRSARLMKVPIETKGAHEIARRSRGTPRVANHLLRWVRDYAQVKASSEITEEVAGRALSMRDIDEDGLDEMDKRVLEAIVSKFDGGPVGLNSVAVAVGEDASTLEDVHEPYLVMMGYVKRTSRGRVAMPSAYRKLGLVPPTTGQTELF